MADGVQPVPSRPPRGTLAAASVVGPASRKGAGRPRALRGHPRFRRCSVSCPSAELPRWRRPTFVTALSPSAIDDARDDRRRGGRGSQGRGGRRRGCGEESGEGQEGGGKRAMRNSIATPRRPGQTGSAPSRRPSTTIGSSNTAPSADQTQRHHRQLNQSTTISSSTTASNSTMPIVSLSKRFSKRT